MNYPTLPFDRKGPDPTAGFHGGNKESKKAWESLDKKDLFGLRMAVYQAIRFLPMCCEQVEKMLGMSHQTASARITELKARGYLEKIGSVKTESGRSASVYRVTDKEVA